MCGIAGWIDLSRLNAGPQVLKRMTDTISHRGPDGEGAYHAQTRNQRYSVALGHRRLAIIDPKGGVQPMISADGEVALVFNGEIYNFQALRDELRLQGFVFSTNSDTEVVLNAWRAWGVDCLRRFRGMFAFALWDAGREVFFIARDRFGKKPVFLHLGEDRIVFASEIKAVLAYGVECRQDNQSALDYLQYRYVPAPATMFCGISKLMPGSYLMWQNGKAGQAQYAVPPDGEPAPSLDADAQQNPVGAFTSILDESVRLRMISDVPFGAFLSGGLDSSAIVALMSRHSSLPINTFSVGFKEGAFDETHYARQVAQQFKTNHHEWSMQADDVIRLLPEAIRFRDAPIAEPTDVAVMVLSQLAAQSVKMVLTGEGADEFLAGYPKHRFERWVSGYQRVVPQALHKALVEPLVDALPERFYRLRTVSRAFGMRDPHERLPRWFGSLSLKEREKLVVSDSAPRAVSGFAFAGSQSISALRKCLYFDQTSWLPDNLLERGDRMTMAASIEARMPFMDQDLAAFIAMLPDSSRIHKGTQKYILREAMKEILPSEILFRRKVGFRIPVSVWFKSTLKDYLQDTLLGSSAKSQAIYKPGAVRLILEEHANSRVNHEKLIWSLLSFELFQREYGLSC